MGIIDTLGQMLSSPLRMGAYDYCHLETAHDPNTFVAKDGEFVSFIEVRGTQEMVGDNQFALNIDFLSAQLAGALAKPGYRLQFVFVRDPEASTRAVADALGASLETARRLKLEVGSILDEKCDLLSRKTSAERAVLVVTTKPSTLPPVSMKKALAERTTKDHKANGIGLKSGQYGQSPLVAVKEIYQAHTSFRDKIITTLKRIVDVQLMEVHEALRLTRLEIDPEFTARKWSPVLPGDKIPVRFIADGNPTDLSHLQWPAIGYQLFNRDIKVCDEQPSIIQIGNRLIAPLLVEMPPQTCLPFGELFANIDTDIPYRWSFTLETGTKQIVSKLGTKRSLAMLLAFTSSENKLVIDGCSELMAMADGGEVLLNGYMSLATWGGTIDEVVRRRAMLAQAVQSWGYTEVLEERGDPVAGVVDTLPGVFKRPISVPFPVTLTDALTMLPISRPASPWRDGAVLFRTLDNKMYPYQPGSSQQAMWIDLVFARPGSGKSVFLSATNHALIAAPGNDRLPRIGVIDIGYSSASFVQMIKSALPAHRRHEAESYRLRMTREYAINPFDTPLGCRFPLAVDKSFLVNFITMLLTPIGSAVIPGMAEVASQMIDSMYAHFSENPKLYETYVDESVDRALSDHNIELPVEASWWEVVDALFAQGLYHEAALAQRYAVPLLGDATTILSQDQTIKDIYAEARTPHGEGLLSAASRMLSSSIRDYPILASPSMFDIGAARIVSMDLAEVAKSGGEAADRQTAIMYMLSRYILCREFYRDASSLDEMPFDYRAYHQVRIEEERQAPKKICFDEFHRTKNTPLVREQVVVDMREGRKFNVHVAVVSQREEDFSEDMVNLATNVFILDRGTETTIRKIEHIFNPPADAIQALRHHVTGPTAEGAPFLYLGVTKGANIAQVLRLTLGPQELWAYSTTVEDVAIRTSLAEQVGLPEALRTLGRVFPSGTAKNFIESKIAEYNHAGHEGEQAKQKIIDGVTAKLIRESSRKGQPEM